MVNKNCESHGTSYPGQYGCRRGRSAVDAVGILINGVQEAWGRGKIATDPRIYVKSAFQSMAKGFLVKKMRETGFDKNLVEWTKSFMGEKRVTVVMTLDGYEGPAMDVISGIS
jgi:hypothetical protein